MIDGTEYDKKSERTTWPITLANHQSGHPFYQNAYDDLPSSQ